jgi:hypothetical protein
MDNRNSVPPCLLQEYRGEVSFSTGFFPDGMRNIGLKLFSPKYGLTVFHLEAYFIPDLSPAGLSRYRYLE